MTKISVNLVPKQRQEARCRNSRIKFWVSSCGGYALLWLIALIFVNVIGVADPEALGSDLEEINERAKAVEAELAQLRSDLGRSNAELAASQKIGFQPDWSVLLSLLSTTIGDSIVLRDCQLLTNQASDSSSSKNARPTFLQEEETAKESVAGLGSVELLIAGLGLSQQDVSEYVLRLEQLELFNQVKLVETRREPFLDSQAIAFHIQCNFNNSEAVNP